MPHARITSSADQQQVFGQPFPLVYQWTADTASADAVHDAATWASEHSDELAAQAATHGAVLLREFPLKSAEHFDAFVSATRFENFVYDRSLSNAVRVNLTDRVFTANEAPSDVEIYLHHEMAQTPIYPSKLLFFCEKAPEQGGATPLCRSDLLFDQLTKVLPNFAQRCEALGVKYTNVMPDEDDAGSGQGRSWKRTFGAETREASEARMRELGYTWTWQDGSLRATTPRLPAVRALAGGERRSFFNQLIAAYRGWNDSRNDPSKSITFGDGSPMDGEAVLAAAKLAEQITFDLQWRAGDVALVDNFVTMHGRRPFVGTRRVLASLVA